MSKSFDSYARQRLFNESGIAGLGPAFQPQPSGEDLQQQLSKLFRDITPATESLMQLYQDADRIVQDSKRGENPNNALIRRLARAIRDITRESIQKMHTIGENLKTTMSQHEMGDSKPARPNIYDPF